MIRLVFRGPRQITAAESDSNMKPTLIRAIPCVDLTCGHLRRKAETVFMPNLNLTTYLLKCS